MEDLITIYYDSEIKSVFLKEDNTTVIGNYQVFTGTADNCVAVANLLNLGNIEMLTDFIANLNLENETI